MSDGTQLVRYDAMCSAIAAAYSLDEVKDIHDKARALEMYARQAKNTEAERQACEIRLRAERKAGVLSSQMETAQGRRTDITSCHDGTKLDALERVGISPTQASRWERLADVPEDDFEAALAGPDKPTTRGILAAHSEPRQSPVDPRALWLWGRLLDFEREGLLSADPNALTRTMLEHMQATTAEMAPRVAAWLGRIGNDG